MRLNFVFLFFLFSFINLQAQYTDIINSNRPGFSESPYSVGSGVYQLESNTFFRKVGIEPTFSKPQSLGLDLLFRTSFFSEKLELNTQITYQKDKVAFKNIFTSHYFTTGLSRLTIGGKYLIFEQKYKDKSKEIRSWKKRFAFDKRRLIPSVAIYLGVNTDFVNDIHKTNQVSPKVGLLLQSNITNNFNFLTNLFYDKIGTDFVEFSYIITSTQNLNDRWSTFFENQYTNTQFLTTASFGTGLAYLANRNLQFNTSLRILFENSSRGFFSSFGISYRLDRHIHEIRLDANKNEIKKKSKKRSKKKSFFGKLFGKKKND